MSKRSINSLNKVSSRNVKCGFRVTGHRKKHLIDKFHKEMVNIHKKGVSTNALAKLMKVKIGKKKIRLMKAIKCPESVPTKYWNGIISELVEFRKVST